MAKKCDKRRERRYGKDRKERKLGRSDDTVVK
jgi:hypothetical protein